MGQNSFQFVPAIIANLLDERHIIVQGTFAIADMTRTVKGSHGR